MDDVDKAIALASKQELERLGQPTRRSQQPVNFARAILAAPSRAEKKKSKKIQMCMCDE